MSAISIKSILPGELLGDDSQPIGSWGMPPTTMVTRVGFESNGQPVFEDETPVGVRLCQRDWQYQRYGEERVRTANRWRLEVLIKASEAGPLKPGHFVAVAQEPYSNQWVQYANLLNYSKKGERKTAKLPVDFSPEADPVDWLERWLVKEAEADPWENSARYVAGISYPNGFWGLESRNTAGDLIFGACRDRDQVVEKLMNSPKITALLRATERNQVKFIFPRVNAAPPLLPKVIDEAPALMDTAILQALAGPPSLEGWKNREVAEWAGMIFCDHLNNRNRTETRRSEKERQQDLE